MNPNAPTDELAAVFRLAPEFQTLRTNLAMASAFTRQAIVEPVKISDDHDLGFLGVRSGIEQFKAHNSAVLVILAALLHQALQNYDSMKQIKPALEDRDLEEYLDEDGTRDEFVEGLRVLRNGLFHVPYSSEKRRRKLAAFQAACEKRGNVLSVVYGLWDSLYDFTEKCFLGKLPIWPAEVYSEITKIDEAMEKSRPGWKEKVDRGEISLIDYFEKYDSICREKGR